MLQKDLDKLRYLSELPEMFKEALQNYEDLSKNAASSAMSDENPSSGLDVQAIFGKTLNLYKDYSDILIVYRKTKFMENLYNDIKSNI